MSLDVAAAFRASTAASGVANARGVDWARLDAGHPNVTASVITATTVNLV